jgi:hypothetical protein
MCYNPSRIERSDPMNYLRKKYQQYRRLLKDGYPFWVDCGYASIAIVGGGTSLYLLHNGQDLAATLVLIGMLPAVTLVFFAGLRAIGQVGLPKTNTY